MYHNIRLYSTNGLACILTIIAHTDHQVIPNNGPLTGLIAVLPMQLIAYELSCLKGVDPDTPRNLAKAVSLRVCV